MTALPLSPAGQMPKAGTLLFLLALFAVLWFGTLDYRKLINPDEARYAEIPREMVATGDWLTPRLNGFKYFEKPALQYWATATSFTLFGEHEWTARLWSALCGFLGIFATAVAVRRMWGARAALFSTSVLAGSLLWVCVGHINTLDMGVSLFLSSAIFCFILAQRDAANPQETQRCMWLGWLALGLAVMSKGLIGLVLPAATLVAYSLWHRDFAIWRKLHLLSGLAILLAVTAPWFIAVSLANPEFARFFFIHEHFERFLTKVHGRYQPAWYFIPILLAGMLPWLTGMFSMLRNGARRDAGSGFQPRRFLLLWCLVVFGFFSASSSKLAAYILPMFPALATLIGLHLAERCRNDATALRSHALFVAILAGLCLLLIPQAKRFGDDPASLVMYADYIHWLFAASGVLLGAAVIAYFQARRARVDATMLTLAFGGMLFAQIILLGHNSLAPKNSSAHIAEQVRNQIKPGVPFFSVGMYDQGLPFYLNRNLTMVIDKDELAFGIEQEPGRFVADHETFLKLWSDTPEAWAVIPPETHARYHAKGVSMHEVARDSRRVIVKKP